MAVRSGFDKKKKKGHILNAISVQVPRTGMNLVNMLTYMTIVIIITIALVNVIAKINAWQTLALCITMLLSDSYVIWSDDYVDFSVVRKICCQLDGTNWA